MERVTTKMIDDAIIKNHAVKRQDLINHTVESLRDLLEKVDDETVVKAYNNVITLWESDDYIRPAAELGETLCFKTITELIEQVTEGNYKTGFTFFKYVNDFSGVGSFDIVRGEQ